ncbi:MAG: hypothetical protein ACRC0M_05090, partial [Legionella sp.]
SIQRQKELHSHKIYLNCIDRHIKNIEKTTIRQIITYWDENTTEDSLADNLYSSQLENLEETKKNLLSSESKNSESKKSTVLVASAKKSTEKPSEYWLEYFKKIENKKERSHPYQDQLIKLYDFRVKIDQWKATINEVKQFIDFAGWFGILSNFSNIEGFNQRFVRFYNEALTMLSINENSTFTDSNAYTALLSLEADTLPKFNINLRNTLVCPEILQDGALKNEGLQLITTYLTRIGEEQKTLLGHLINDELPLLQNDQPSNSNNATTTTTPAPQQQTEASAQMQAAARANARIEKVTLLHKQFTEILDQFREATTDERLEVIKNTGNMNLDTLRNRDNDTLLHCMIREGLYSQSSWLVAHETSVLVKNASGETALALAAKYITADKIVDTNNKHCGINLFSRICEQAAKQMQADELYYKSFENYGALTVLNSVLEINSINKNVNTHTLSKAVHYDQSNQPLSGFTGFFKYLTWILTSGRSPKENAVHVVKIYEALAALKETQNFDNLIRDFENIKEGLSFSPFDNTFKNLLTETIDALKHNMNSTACLSYKEQQTAFMVTKAVAEQEVVRQEVVVNVDLQLNEQQNLLV